jgi:hypothetical protein
MAGSGGFRLRLEDRKHWMSNALGARLEEDSISAGAVLDEWYFMKGFLNFFGMSVGGWIGWAIGAPVSIFTAFMVSMVGTGIGLFYTQRLIKRLLP